MGMFDSIYIRVKCPFCSKESEMECQTKELDCSLEVWKEGDFVGDKSLSKLECSAVCRSNECKAHTEKQFGYKSGDGRIFCVDAMLNGGIVTGKYEITNMGY